jgi:hypothetical protein
MLEREIWTVPNSKKSAELGVPPAGAPFTS